MEHVKYKYHKWSPFITTTRINIYVVIDIRSFLQALETVVKRTLRCDWCVSLSGSPPPLCVGSALVSVCPSCSFCSAPPPRPANTQVFAQSQAKSRRNKRAVTHLQKKYGAVDDDGMTWTGICQEKNIQTFCAVGRQFQFHIDHSSAGIIATEGQQAPI